MREFFGNEGKGEGRKFGMDGLTKGQEAGGNNGPYEDGIVGVKGIEAK